MPVARHWGACPPGPAYRGPWATSPSWPGLLRLAPARHTGNVASITTQRTELAGRLGDSAKMILAARESRSLVTLAGPMGPVGFPGTVCTGNEGLPVATHAGTARRSGLHGTDYARVDWQFH